ncbi:MAG: hypothetical protein ABW033_11330 [Acidimicrobiia bacterium]
MHLARDADSTLPSTATFLLTSCSVSSFTNHGPRVSVPSPAWAPVLVVAAVVERCALVVVVDDQHRALPRPFHVPASFLGHWE